MFDQSITPEVEPHEAHRRMNDGAVILDVREQDELAQASISGALHIPLGELHNRVAEVPQDQEVFVLCHVGQRSAMATDFLRQLGHQSVWNIRGGIIAWYRARLPVDLPERD
ncbi:MAG: rhodanese-like domain-containing protein [Sphaerobacteraceae bacterium]|nr:MAG: rhodanese-like domain-containing protein [Sphaerobacteraceae bacterium]